MIWVQGMSQVGMALQLNCQGMSQGLILPHEMMARGRALVCSGSRVSGQHGRSVS